MDPVRAIADAVLYEGYVLWPYTRSALKNQQRWTFGGLYPRGWPEDRSEMVAQCLVEGEGAQPPAVDVRARFLHVVRRQVVDAGGEPVDELTVDGERHLSWDEAVEREIESPGPFTIPADRHEEPLPGGGGKLVRSWEAVSGTLEAQTQTLRPGVHRLTVRVTNAAQWDGAPRGETVRITLCSTHAVLRTRDGAFVSLADPPAALAEDVDACRQEGVWPVLVGEQGEHHTMLVSPIILSDHPEIAPESPGDLFDGGEIDGLLVLSILALTDDEKAEMRASDPRTREILERTEALTPEQRMALHGTVREMAVRSR